MLDIVEDLCDINKDNHEKQNLVDSGKKKWKIRQI